MPVIRTLPWATITGDTTVALQGADGFRIAPDSGSTPRIIGISGGQDGQEIAIQNLSGMDVEVVNKSVSIVVDNQRVITTGLGGDFTLPDGQTVWAILVDPNDLVLDNSKRGWYADSGGQEILVRDAVLGVTSAPTKSDATPAVLAEMTKTGTFVGGMIQVAFVGGFELQDGDAGTLAIYLDGTIVPGTEMPIAYTSSEGVSDPVASIQLTISTFKPIIGVAAGEHTVDIRWAATSGTLRAVGTRRIISVIETP